MAPISMIEDKSGRLVYPKLVDFVRQYGTSRFTRGQKTRDVGMVIVQLNEASDALPVACGRNLKPAIGAVEAVQLVGGFQDADLVCRVSEHFKQFRETENGFHGAYGARVHEQVACATHKILQDPGTRQAIVTLWDPWLDNLPDKKDYPCTVSLQFQLGVDLRLEMNVLMRSNDVWLGFPYDVFQFTQLQQTVAAALGAEPGTYTHTTWSLHMYERDVEASSSVHSPHFCDDCYTPTRTSTVTGFGRPGDDFLTRARRARAIGLGTPDRIKDLTESEQWYVEQLSPYYRP